RYLSATDDEALAAAALVTRTEGILPALETAHPFAKLGAIATERSRELKRPATIVLCLSGRGDKDLSTYLTRLLGTQPERAGWAASTTSSRDGAPRGKRCSSPICASATPMAIRPRPWRSRAQKRALTSSSSAVLSVIPRRTAWPSRARASGPSLTAVGSTRRC